MEDRAGRRHRREDLGLTSGPARRRFFAKMRSSPPAGPSRHPARRRHLGRWTCRSIRPGRRTYRSKVSTEMPGRGPRPALVRAWCPRGPPPAGRPFVADPTAPERVGRRAQREGRPDGRSGSAGPSAGRAMPISCGPARPRRPSSRPRHIMGTPRPTVPDARRPLRVRWGHAPRPAPLRSRSCSGSRSRPPSSRHPWPRRTRPSRRRSPCPRGLRPPHRRRGVPAFGRTLTLA